MFGPMSQHFSKLVLFCAKTEPAIAMSEMSREGSIVTVIIGGCVEIEIEVDMDVEGLM